MSFTLAWKGTADLVDAGATDVVAGFFVACAETFFTEAAGRV
jgi:hypothetical protein